MNLRLCLVLILLLTFAAEIALAAPKYRIIDETKSTGIKRSLVVRLSERASKSELRRIALAIKAKDPARYERTFIVYYLPDMLVDAGGWASTHFNPNLKIQIFGLTREEHAALAKRASSKEVLGSWMDTGFSAGLITIERKSGKLVMRKAYKDGSASTKELRNAASLRPGTRLDYKKDARYGDHLRISSKGHLEFWDNDGLIAVAPKH